MPEVRAGTSDFPLRIMNNKVNTACKSVAVKSNKNSLENYKGPMASDSAKVTTAELPENIVAHDDNYSTLIEVTVKSKGRKRSCTMVSSSPSGHKAVEDKKRSSSSGESYQNWGRILREQNRPTMKQGLQQFALTNRAPKSTKLSGDNKESRKRPDTQKRQTQEFSRVSKRVEQVSEKQFSSQKKSEDRIKSIPQTTVPSSTSLASSVESILIVDRGVQCGGIFDTTNRFEVFNPVRTIAFLMKELEDLVKDERSSKILHDMEQALFRIPTEAGKSTATELEAIALRTKLDASTMQLEEMSKKMRMMCESLRDERDSLQRQVHKQAGLLEEARLREVNFDTALERLKQELEDARRTIEIKEKIICELREENKSIELSQKIIADLKADVSKQSELARQRHLEIQYLTLEKEKLSVLAAYKDTLLEELRNSVKELQNHIVKQLSDLKQNYVYEDEMDKQISFARAGLVCSSPTSSASGHSNVLASWREISDVSLSSAVQNPCSDSDSKRPTLENEKILPLVDSTRVERKRSTNLSESRTNDNAQLQFISLPAGESSHAILFPSYKDPGYRESSQSAARGKDDTILANTGKDDGDRRVANAAEAAEVDHLRDPVERSGKVKRLVKTSSKSRKSSGQDKKPRAERRAPDESCAIANNNASNNDPIGSNIKEQFKNIFEDLRLQSRIPVSVPSPPRDFPHPDWSDSSLPSISAVSEINIVRSNET